MMSLAFAVSADATHAAPAASTAQDAPFGSVVASGASIKRTVSPRRAFRIRIPRVGTLSGPRGAVSSRGRLIIRRYRATLARGLSAGGMGVDVRLRGAKLLRSLTLTQRVRRGPRGAVPVVAHRDSAGLWDMRRGRLVRGPSIRIVTKRFSTNVPAWLDPRQWARALGDRLAASIGGRTSPWDCPVGPPAWFSVTNRSSTVHACAMGNSDAAGERGEVRIKSNRGAFQRVTLAGARDYAWVESQPDIVRALVGRATGTDPGNVVFLGPGNDGMMTVGYRRPARSATYSLLVETTYTSVLLNGAYFTVDAVAGGVSARVKHGAAVYVLAKCSGVLNLASGAARDPRDAVRGTTFLDMLSCIANEAAASFSDPARALRAALELTDHNLARSELQRYTEDLTRVGGGFKALARVLVLRSALQQGWQGVSDTLAALISDGASTHVDVAMQAAPAPPTQTTTPTTTPPPTTTQPTTTPPPPPPPPAEREVVIYNKVTNDATTMREDTPAYLSTVPKNFCKRDGCALPGTDMGTGFRIVAFCQTTGARTTNGWDANSIDDHNPGLFESTRWYGMRWADGRTGYLSEVWVDPAYRGGMGLRGC